MPNWSDDFANKLKDQIITVVITLLAGALLTGLTFLFVQGGAVSLMGGVTAAQISKAKEYRIVAVCPNSYMNNIELGKSDKVFCALIETATFSSPAASTRNIGWRTCKIEEKSDDKGTLYLKAEIWADAEQMCVRDPGATIVCRARCISLPD
jgi:hypothetical protein